MTNIKKRFIITLVLKDTLMLITTLLRSKTAIAMKKKKIILLLSFLNIFIALGLGRFLFSLIVPYLRTVYIFSYVQIGTLWSLLLLGYMVFSYLGGIANHRIGERLVIIISLAVISFSFCAFYFIRHFLLLCFASFSMGSSAASLYMSIFQLIHEYFDEDIYGKEMGIMLAGAGCGIFVLSTFALLLTITGSSFNILVVWIASAVMALILIPLNAQFLVQERLVAKKSLWQKSRYIKIWRRIFAEPLLRKSTLAYCFYGFSYAGYLNYIVAYTEELGGGNASILAWVFFGLTSIFSGYIWGKWFDKGKARTVLNYNYALAGAAIFLPILLRSRIFALISSFSFGFCFFGYITIFGVIIVRKTKGLSSVYMGKITLLHAAGQVIGAFIGGILRDLTGSFTAGFALAFGVHLISCWYMQRYFKEEKYTEGGKKENSILSASGRIVDQNINL